MKPDRHLVNRLLLWKWEKRELNKSLSKTLANIGKRIIGLQFFTKYFALFLWTEIMLDMFPVLGKIPWLKEDLKIWTRGSVIESLHNWTMRIEMLSNPWAFVGFNDLIIVVIPSFLMETVFKRLSVLINNEGSFLCLPKEYTGKQKIH